MSSPVSSPNVAPRAPLRRICVYCASSTGTNEHLTAATRTLGEQLVERNIELVYGGGAVGLMGLVADTVMAAGGAVTGVIPTGLFPIEVAHTGLTRLVEVNSMHERKTEMIRLADGFIALPGGFGTLEEVAEVLTWAQLGMHRKPVGFLNVDGFYDQLLAFFDRCVSDQVLKPKNRELVLCEADPGKLLDAFADYQPVFEGKWIGLDQI